MQTIRSVLLKSTVVKGDSQLYNGPNKNVVKHRVTRNKLYVIRESNFQRMLVLRRKAELSFF